MYQHDPDINPLLDEIASRAADPIGSWLIECEDRIDTQFGAGCAEKHPGAVAALANACATVYAAHLIADYLGSIANGIETAADARIAERLAGIETEIHQLVNLAADAIPRGKNQR